MAAYDGDALPIAEVATVDEADAIWIRAIDGRPFTGNDQKAGFMLPTGPKAGSYAVLPGNHTLTVGFRRFTGQTWMSSANDRTIEFTAEAGKTYTLDGTFATFHPTTLQNEHWTPRLLNEAGEAIAEAK